MSTINIAGLPKEIVLQALFNASKQQGMGFMDKRGAEQMSIEKAIEIVDEYEEAKAPLSFDYLLGRVMKVSIDGDEFSPRLFDRDNGEGAAARAIDRIRV